MGRATKHDMASASMTPLAVPRYAMSDFHIDETIGEGTFSRVHKATLRDAPSEGACALKVIKKTLRPQDLQVVQAEAAIMARLEHDNVLRLKGKVMDKGVLAALQLELASDEDFFSLIETKGKMSDALTRHYFRQLMLALQHCHSRGIAHRDVKPENLLLGPCFKLTLTDFGLAWASDPSLGVPPANMMCKTRTGTVPYMAPELFGKSMFSSSYDATKLDVWSAGVSLFILIAGFPPWGKATFSDKFFGLTSTGMATFWTCMKRWADFSDEAIDLLTGMLNRDCHARFTVNQVLQHPFCNPERQLTDAEVQDLMLARGHTCPCAMAPMPKNEDVRPAASAMKEIINNNCNHSGTFETSTNDFDKTTIHTVTPAVSSLHSCVCEAASIIVDLTTPTTTPGKEVEENDEKLGDEEQQDQRILRVTFEKRSIETERTAAASLPWPLAVSSTNGLEECQQHPTSPVNDFVQRFGSAGPFSPLSNLPSGVACESVFNGKRPADVGSNVYSDDDDGDCGCDADANGGVVSNTTNINRSSRHQLTKRVFGPLLTPFLTRR